MVVDTRHCREPHEKLGSKESLERDAHECCDLRRAYNCAEGAQTALHHLIVHVQLQIQVLALEQLPVTLHCCGAITIIQYL